jgi:hypothetical protein
MFVVKECTKCKEYKILQDFRRKKTNMFGYYSQCKICESIYNSMYFKKYYENNKVELIEYQKEYVKNNKHKVYLRNSEYQKNNRSKINEYVRNKKINDPKYKIRFEEYQKKYRKEKAQHINRYILDRRSKDPLFKLRSNISSLIKSKIKNKGYKKNSKVSEILGCDFETFKAHLEKQFTKGMTWQNQGEWHLDHIYPVSKARDEKHLLELNHYTNFQPLWAKDNIRKGNKIIEKQLFLL